VLPNNETMSYSKLALSAVALLCVNNTSARSLVSLPPPATAVSGEPAAPKGADRITFSR
jgi:hypothetical protein